MVQLGLGHGDKYPWHCLCRDIAKLAEQYPFVEIHSIGRSVEGRNLWAIRLGTGPRQIFYMAGLHANEWLTTPLLMNYCFDYCESLQNRKPVAGFNVEEIFDHSTIWVAPAMNPDGAELVQCGISQENPYYESVLNINGGSVDFRGWKANIWGIDLNHQFPANWALQAANSPRNPSARDHAGAGPLSEPEALALAEFTKQQDFAMVLAFHSQGEIIYWGYRRLEPPASSTIAKNMSALTGYQSVPYAGTHAGYKDWFIQDWRRPGFTIEVGRGVNPLPGGMLPVIYRKLIKLLFWCGKV
ncbi:MAG TPA: M14 family metallocarboxypeptidase [Verrucomicrobiae bacterium]|nr:M14 family metallocarboxypeptidase [Verrucomicrobiae bacterium]